MKIVNTSSNNSFIATNEKSILESAMDNGINYPHSCTNGFCGQCKALITKGEISYKDGVPDGLLKEDEKDGYALLCQCYPETDIELVINEINNKIEPTEITAKVIKLEKLNRNVVLLILSTDTPISFIPGQYFDVHHDGFECSAFSLANKPGTTEIEFHIRVVTGGKFTNFIFNKLQINTEIKLFGPKGKFSIQEGDKDIIMIAGGTGLAPIKSIIDELIFKKDKRKIKFYWGVRNKIDLYTTVPEAWQKLDNIEYIPVLSDNYNWTGKSGLVHTAVLKDIKDFSNYHVYACGPSLMIKAISSSFTSKGMNSKDFFYDNFTP